MGNVSVHQLKHRMKNVKARIMTFFPDKDVVTIKHDAIEYLDIGFDGNTPLTDAEIATLIDYIQTETECVVSIKHKNRACYEIEIVRE